MYNPQNKLEVDVTSYLIWYFEDKKFYYLGFSILYQIIYIQPLYVYGKCEYRWLRTFFFKCRCKLFNNFILFKSFFAWNVCTFMYLSNHWVWIQFVVFNSMKKTLFFIKSLWGIWHYYYMCIDGKYYYFATYIYTNIYIARYKIDTLCSCINSILCHNARTIYVDCRWYCSTSVPI